MRILICMFILAVFNVAQVEAFGSETVNAQFVARTPTNVASRISSADRIVATNWLEVSHGGKGFGLSIEGSQVAKIIEAVSNAWSYCDGTSLSMWDWELQFYRGTNLLYAIHFQGRVFLTDCEYTDDSGTLEQIYDHLLQLPEAAEQNRYGDEWLTATNKAEAKQWLKGPSHGVLNGKKEKVVHFVEDFYTAGASEVVVGGIRPRGEAETPTADFLAVVLPKESAARKEVFLVAEQAFKEWWNDLEWNKDVGQNYLFFSFKNEPRVP